ncbi:MAG: DNA methyltransferase [Pseudomonadota bacterium]
MTKNSQQSLGLGDNKKSGPVECLGQTFPSDDARREHYLKLLAEKLKDPEFRKTPGFPKGSDEDILRLSDPPYYTPCPNPFLADFVRVHGKSYDPAEQYHREPFAEDLSERRTDNIYTAHTYHTKVPPRAIARLIMHFTEPGDLVLDAFCGTGMTGVAAALCADASLASEFNGVAGPRRSILCDIAPAATFIAATYVNPPDAVRFQEAGEDLVAATATELDELWTLDVAGRRLPIDFVVWVECFSCPHCQADVVSERVLDATDSIGSAKDFPCPSCGGLVGKAPTKESTASRLIRTLRTSFDSDLLAPAQRINRVPIAAEVRRQKERIRVELTQEQRDHLLRPPGSARLWFPIDPVVDGERFRVKDCLASYGIRHVHHFYLPRQLATYAQMWRRAEEHPVPHLRNALRFFVSSNALGMTVLNRFAPTHHSQVNRYFSGTLYVPSTVAETSPVYAYTHKLTRLTQAFRLLGRTACRATAITTQSATSIGILPSDSIDYVFVDPPFGRNLQYSELNQIWEAWLRVFTNRDPEAVMDVTRKRGVVEYSALMRLAFVEMRRVLKPGRWITVEFHNSANAVWMAIQEAMTAAGLVVADVRVLNKESDTYKQAKQGLVKRDLMISAYKPTEELEQQFQVAVGRPDLAWAFVRMHLGHLPVFAETAGDVEVIAERLDYMLFDRMVAFHVQRGVSVPMSAPEFYAGLLQRFPLRDAMYFLPDQVAEYDRKRARASSVKQLALFVNDEASAIQWLRFQLTKKPQPFHELQPAYMREVQSWAPHEKGIELRALLEENFLRYDGKGAVPSQIHSYLSTNFKDLRNLDKDDPTLKAKAEDRWYVPDPNKEGDLEKLRQRTLLKEFEDYRSSASRKIKQFRTEAVRAGFKHCYDNQDYQTVVDVAAKLPDQVIQEDEKLLMYFDVATMRLGVEG